MNVRVIAAMVLVLTMTIKGSAQANKVKDDNTAQSDVRELNLKLANGEVGRIEILQIPARILTRTRITPDMLEKQFSYKLTIRDIRGSVHRSKLEEAMKSTMVQPQSDMADVRWGLIFYGVDDKRLLAMHFDKSGRNGAVGDTAVSFRGDLFTWLDDNFSKCFR